MYADVGLQGFREVPVSREPVVARGRIEQTSRRSLKRTVLFCGFP